MGYKQNVYRLYKLFGKNNIILKVSSDTLENLRMSLYFNVSIRVQKKKIIIYIYSTTFKKIKVLYNIRLQIFLNGISDVTLIR